MYNNNSFDVNVLVKGNRCKIYHHNGKKYIEAKHGSEYELEIKNNTFGRVLAITSVDGLNVLNGESASTEGPGYIIPSHSPLRIKGFRYSNNEVAAFKFTDKHNSYAKSIGGSEAAQNCGIIGFLIYDEFVRMPVIKYHTFPETPIPFPPPYNPCHPYGPVYGGTIRCMNTMEPNSVANDNNILMDCSVKSANFDMGSTWGQKVESKVVETEFEKGNIVFNFDIYYASRESLLKMGVVLNESPKFPFHKVFLVNTQNLLLVGNKIC